MAGVLIISENGQSPPPASTDGSPVDGYVDRGRTLATHTWSAVFGAPAVPPRPRVSVESRKEGAGRSDPDASHEVECTNHGSAPTAGPGTPGAARGQDERTGTRAEVALRRASRRTCDAAGSEAVLVLAGRLPSLLDRR
jgi:hypothetical protein